MYGNWILVGIEPMAPSREATHQCLRPLSHQVIQFWSKLLIYSTPKIDQLWMVFKAKNGPEWTQLWL